MAATQTKPRKHTGLKVLAIVLAVLVILICALVTAVSVVWGNEISTAVSLTKVRDRDDAHEDGSVYTMTVKGGFYFDEYIEQGGAKSDSELITFITDHITKGLIDMGLQTSEIACSAFTAVTEDGDRVFGRNYDFSKTNTCIVYTDAGNGRHATVSTVDLQFLGIDGDKDVEGLMDRVTCLAAPFAPLDGMNDAGLTCGIFMSYQGEETTATDVDTDKPDLTSTTMLRLILDYASTVEEAVALVEKYDMHDSAQTSFHYMIADATGKSAILEWTNGTDLTDNDGSKRVLNVIYNDDDERIGEREGASDFQWITNFILQPGYYESDDQKPGYDRYNQLYTALSATDGVVKDMDAAMDILASVGRRDWNNDDSNSITVHSVVYNLTDKTAIWIPNEHYDDADARFELSL
mgnify:FL=1